METLEERNLNRLRNGKMMLEYADVKRSWMFSMLLVLFFGMLGIHRFYLGQKKWGVAILIGLALFVLTPLSFDESNPLVILSLIFPAWILIELVLTPWLTTNVNRRIKDDLKIKYSVLDYS